MATLATGYGPSRRLLFDGDEAKYELWEIKFLGYLRLHKLYDVILAEEEPKEGDVEKNIDAFAQLIQCLDDRSLSLVMRDAKDDGRKALKILRNHYMGKSKPRVLALYTELTSLQKGHDECITDYVLRAETAAASLKSAGETVSDSLLIAMVLKGLPTEYKTFSAIVSQRDEKDDKMKFQEFKVALRSYEETEKSCTPPPADEDNVLNCKLKSPAANGSVTCYSCGQPGHKSPECRSKDKKKKKGNRWCSHCKSKTHNTDVCRKKDSAKTVSDDKSDKRDASFAFKVTVDNFDSVREDSLLVDTGATAHILNDKSKFLKFDKDFKPENHYIELADGSRACGVVSAKGRAKIILHDVEGVAHEVFLEGALYIPSYRQNIFSVQSAINKGSAINLTPNSAELSAPDGTKFAIKKHGKLYYLNSTISSSGAHTAETWHRILGHCNMSDVFKLEGIVEGMKITSKGKPECGTCVQGKMSQYRNREPDRRATAPLQLVHSDLAGPITPVSREGHKYAMVFVDDFSGAFGVYFLKNKSDATRATEQFLADTAPYGSVKRLRSDNGGEYISEEFKSLLLKNHIKHETSAPYSPHQNGTAERAWRSIFDMARCLLIDAELPKQFWTYAVMTSAHIRNRCYNPRTGKTPYECLTGIKPNLSNMHVFGSVCYAYVQNTTKLDPRAEKGIFVGYDRSSPAFLVYCPQAKTVRKVRCVKFTENFDNVDETVELLPDSVKPGEPEKPTHGNEDANVRRYPARDHARPKYLDDYVTGEDIDDAIDDTANCTIDFCYRLANVPQSYQDAISSPEANKWRDAMSEELNALWDNETYELTPLPEGRTSVGGKWVYAVKLGPNGEEKYKARFVAKGYSQVPGIDYHETFSPTARISSVRMLMQLAVQEGMVVHQMDVKTAYLNAPIDCELYMEQPEGYERKGPNGEKLVCKLKKSLYGLKQSGRNWNNMLHNYFTQEGFVQSLADPCVYVKGTETGRVIAIVWVDDIIISASNTAVLKGVKESLMKRFKMKDLGVLSWFLGIQFRCERDCIEMNQTQYVERILSKFKMSDCKPKAVPCELGANKACESNGSEFENASLYREIVGSLIYLMTCTRPDLCYVVTYLSQHLSKPLKTHYGMAKQVLRYLKGTPCRPLRFIKGSQPKLMGYSDSDWAMSSDRRSISGYAFKLCNESSLISWKTRKQSIVALSTCEAEYVALATATQEAKFLRQLLADLTCLPCKSVCIYVDNQGAIGLANNPIHHKRSKHIDVKYHYVRLEIQHGIVELTYVPTDNNVADVFTKPVTRVRLNRLLS